MEKLRDPGSLRGQLASWIEEQVRRAGMRGAVFGLSGGLDSAVVCGLAAEGLGAERCLGLLLPIESAPDDARLARLVAQRFGVETLELALDAPYRALLAELESHRERAERIAGGTGRAADMTAPTVTDSAEVMARANLKPRLRMISLYYMANLLGYLVLGTGNKDEFTVGYFTKWGDGAADAFPLADLVKAEVRALARELDVPGEVVSRAPSAGLWPGQTDEGELGLTYEQLDRFLLTGSSGDATLDTTIRRRNELSRHKTAPAPVATPR